jgi:RNA recognition motif-containing protein
VEDKCKLFVRGLTKGATKDKLSKYFGEFGKVKTVQIRTDETTGEVRGFGFVIFVDEATAKTVVQKARKKELVFGGETLQCFPAEKK